LERMDKLGSVFAHGLNRAPPAAQTRKAGVVVATYGIRTAGPLFQPGRFGPRPACLLLIPGRVLLIVIDGARERGWTRSGSEWA